MEDVIAKRNIEEDIKTKLRTVLQKRRNVFSTVPVKCKFFQYTIELDNNKPLVKKPRPVPLCYRDQVRQKIKTGMNLGTI